MKKIAIIQSCYIPWKGYFDIINMVDEFILFDDVQYTRRDWRNRNKIKTKDGVKWITIPVQVKGKYFQKINETKIADPEWTKKHWAMISQNYSSAPYFEKYKEVFEPLYMNCKEELLSDVNYKFICAINDILGIDTQITWSSAYHVEGDKNDRIISICKQSNATEYLSGPSAKSYVDVSQFLSENIKVSWVDYSNYPIYEQLYPPFNHEVSILDLLFNQGDQAIQYMKSFS